jgi:hypothetical protein
MKVNDGEKEEDGDAAAALSHSVVPAGAPSVYCCGGERSAYCCGGAGGSRGCGSEKEINGNAAAVLMYAVAPV